MTEKQATDLWRVFDTVATHDSRIRWFLYSDGHTITVTGRTKTHAWSYSWALVQLHAAVDPVDLVLRACSWGISQLIPA